jgi:hypothetical protein
MEWEYYTNKSKRRKIDNLLKEAAMLFANCEPSHAAREQAKLEEKEILDKIAKYDHHFAESCGWLNPHQVDEDSEFEQVLLRITLDSKEEVEGLVC